MPAMRVWPLILVLVLTGCGGDDQGDSGASASSSTNGSADGTEGATTQTGSSTGAEVEPYGPCTLASSCFLAGAGDACISAGDGSGGFCAASCTEVSACPEPPAGATPGCEDLSGMGPVCFLDCEAGMCPDGMTCRAIATAAGEQSICFWS